MDSTSVAIFGFAFTSGVELGSLILKGLSVIVVLVVTAKLVRSM